MLGGNAANWWQEAGGLYARGSAPEVGAILSFRGSGRIRLGHVAVVSKVVNSREIDVDHSHWASRGVARGVSVIDVSPGNDWTAVRVALRGSASYGSVYATHGFIYDRAPVARVQMASTRDRQPSGRVQEASATDTAGATDEPGAFVGKKHHVRHLRAHVKRRWHRLVARRRSQAEVAEQPRRR